MYRQQQLTYVMLQRCHIVIILSVAIIPLAQNYEFLASFYLKYAVCFLTCLFNSYSLIINLAYVFNSCGVVGEGGDDDKLLEINICIYFRAKRRMRT